MPQGGLEPPTAGLEPAALPIELLRRCLCLLRRFDRQWHKAKPKYVKMESQSLAPTEIRHFSSRFPELAFPHSRGSGSSELDGFFVLAPPRTSPSHVETIVAALLLCIRFAADNNRFPHLSIALSSAQVKHESARFIRRLMIAYSNVTSNREVPANSDYRSVIARFSTSPSLTQRSFDLAHRTFGLSQSFSDMILATSLTLSGLKS